MTGALLAVVLFVLILPVFLKKGRRTTNGRPSTADQDELWRQLGESLRTSDSLKQQRAKATRVREVSRGLTVLGGGAPQMYQSCEPHRYRR